MGFGTGLFMAPRPRMLGAQPLHCHCRAWPGNPWGRAASTAV